MSLRMCHSPDAIQGESRPSVFGEMSPPRIPLCHLLSSVFFSSSRVHINFTLTLPPICSIHLLDGHSLPLQSNGEFTLPFGALWEAQGNYLWLMWFLLLVLMTKLQRNSALLRTTLGRNLLGFCLPTTTKTWLTGLGTHWFCYSGFVCLFVFLVSWGIKLKMPFTSSLVTWKKNQ